MEKKMFKFEVHLNEHCNLNCKCCDHFSPIAKEEYADFDSVEKDFIRMKELLGNERNVGIYLLGGEPLLNPRIIDYIYMARKHFDNKEKDIIRIVTNGILLNKQKEEFWKACAENDILIAPTHYPISIDYESIKKKSEKYGVKIEFFHSDDLVEYMYNIPLHLKGDLDAKDSFEHCHIASRCAFVRNGKLYCCPRIANIQHFNKKYNKNLKVDEDDFLDIYKIERFDDIEEYLSRPKEFCSHCNTRNLNRYVKWSAGGNTMEDWVSEN